MTKERLDDNQEDIVKLDDLKKRFFAQKDSAKAGAGYLGNDYSFIVESIPNGIVMTDEKGKIIFANTMVYEMFGYKRAELIGKPVEVLVPKRFKKAHGKFRHEYIAEPSSRPMGAGRDLFGLRKDGTEFPVEVGLNPVKTDKGIVVLSTIVDISVRRAAEIKLREERERSQKYLDVAEVIFLALDDRGNVSLINRKGCEILGFAEDEILGKNWFENFIQSPDRGAVLTVYNDLMERRVKKVAFFENKIVSKSGKVNEISWHNTALTDEKGKVVGTLSSGVDVTARKAAERLLQEREERLRGIMDNTIDAILVFDEDGEIEIINKAAIKLFYCDKGDEISNIGELITPEYRDSFEDKLQKARGGAVITDYETEKITKSGNRIPVSISLAYMNQGGGRFIETVRDITSRVIMRNKIIELEKSQLIGKMAEGFAHHIGTPLASMLLRVQMLKEDIPVLPECENVNEKLDSIERQILYGQKVIQRLLKFVSQPGSDKGPEKVDSIAGESIEILMPLLKKHRIEYSADIDDGLTVQVDSNLINLVLTDIMMNALDAMPEGGMLSVTASKAVKEGFVNIGITDTGEGIAKETIPFVFEPFFTTKPAGKGTGLGLSVAKRIISDHGGEISISSREGEGTRVSITLPVTDLSEED